MPENNYDRVLSVLETLYGSASDELAVTVAARESPWATLVATVLSLRTKDEVTRVAAPKLIRAAPTPAAMLDLEVYEIEALIYPTSFYHMKAKALLRIARTLVDKHQSRVPDDIDGLLELHGIGRKSANLIITLGFHKPGVCVDVHVNRISNRLGWVKTKTPEQTEMALRESMPEKWWTSMNGLLIAFGRDQCTPVGPKCSTCPVTGDCAQAGVEKHR